MFLPNREIESKWEEYKPDRGSQQVQISGLDCIRMYLDRLDIIEDIKSSESESEAE
jgi:hypothetical protein